MRDRGSDNSKALPRFTHLVGGEFKKNPYSKKRDSEEAGVAGADSLEQFPPTELSAVTAISELSWVGASSDLT